MFSLKKGYIYIALTTFLFSSMEIALKLVAGNFNSIQMTVSRFFIGGLVLLPLALKNIKSKNISFIKEDFINFLFLGFNCVVISMILYQLAVVNTKASIVATIFSCNPIFILIFAYFMLKQPIYKYNIISLILEVVGIIFIINPLSTKISFVGVTLTLLAALTFALYGVLGKKSTNKFGGVVVTCFSFIFGSLELLVLIIFSHIPSISQFLMQNNLDTFASVPLFTGYTLSSIPIFLFICIGVTGMGFCCYFLAMEYTDANTTSLVFFLKPILAPIMAAIILKEVIPINMIFGIGFILFGSIYTVFKSLTSEKVAEDITA